MKTILCHKCNQKATIEEKWVPFDMFYEMKTEVCSECGDYLVDNLSHERLLNGLTVTEYIACPVA